MKKLTIACLVAIGMTMLGITLAAAKTAEQKFMDAGNAAVDAQAIAWAGTWAGKNAKGKPYILKLYDGGDAKFEFGGRDSGGSWSVKSEKLCTSWKKFRPEPRCDTIYKDDNGYKVFKPDGSDNGSLQKK